MTSYCRGVETSKLSEAKWTTNTEVKHHWQKQHIRLTVIGLHWPTLTPVSASASHSSTLTSPCLSHLKSVREYTKQLFMTASVSTGTFWSLLTIKNNNHSVNCQSTLYFLPITQPVKISHCHCTGRVDVVTTFVDRTFLAKFCRHFKLRSALPWEQEMN